MILKSFFRKKSVKIYLILFLILFITIIILGSSIIKLNLERQKIFQKSSYLYINSTQNVSDLLNSNHNIININKAAVINALYKEPFLDELFLKNNLKQIIVINESSKENLKNDEIIICFTELDYINHLDLVKKLNNKNLSISILDNLYNFKIKKIKDSGTINHLIISESVFNKIFSNKDYQYIANIKNEKVVLETVKDLKENIKGTVSFYNDYTAQNYQKTNSINHMLKQLYFAIVVIIIIFIILSGIINVNLINEEKNNILLQYKLGYRIRVIRNYILLKLITLHIMSILIAYIISFFILQLFQKYFILSNIGIFILLFLLLSDLLLSFLINNKSKIFERR